MSAPGVGAAGRLERLLRPRSIAVVGGREAERMVAQLARIGYAGRVWPVHPRRERVGGVATFADVTSLPAAPDAAFVAVNRERTLEVVAALAARGAGGAVCYASGFRELDGDAGTGARLERALVEAAGAMPLIGPNCYGLVNYADRVLLWPDQFAGVPLADGERGVALVSQSSNLVINLDTQRRGLPVAYVMTAGNQAQTDLAALAAAAIEDRRVSALGIYAESLGEPAALEALAGRARALGKPVVMLKAGRTELARRAALTHTASLAGDDNAAEEFLERLGIAQVDGLETFVETLKLVHAHGALEGFDVVSMSCSGGEAALVADAARGRRLRFPDFAPAARARLAAALGARVAIANPLDYHTYAWGDGARLEQVFEAGLGAGADLTVLMLDLPREDRCDPADWWVSLEAFARSAARAGAPAAVVSTLTENLPEAAAARLLALGVAPLAGLDPALGAIEAAARVGEAWSRPAAPPLLGARAAPSGVRSRVLDEHAAKRLLRAHGLRVPDGRRVTDAASAVDAARAIGGPVAVKALGVAHKTEAGAVRLGVATPEEAGHIAGALLGDAEAVLVERMVEDPVAELLAGVRRVDGLGLALTVASGGVLVELVGDARTVLLPCDETTVRRALHGLRAWRLVEGFRGAPRGDADAVLDAVMALARLGEDLADRLEEIDVNPLIACRAGAGAWAADALVKLLET